MTKSYISLRRFGQSLLAGKVRGRADSVGLQRRIQKYLNCRKRVETSNQSHSTCASTGMSIKVDATRVGVLRSACRSTDCPSNKPGRYQQNRHHEPKCTLHKFSPSNLLGTNQTGRHPQNLDDPRRMSLSFGQGKRKRRQMSSTTNDAEQSSKSYDPQGCVDRSRSAAPSFLCDICHFVNLPCISTTLNATGTWRF